MYWINKYLSKVKRLGHDRVRVREIPDNHYYDLAKQLSHYLYFFSFLFFFFYLGLTIQKGVWESVMSQVSQSHTVTASHHMMSHDKSHDRYGKVVHRPCSSCISSVENLTGTLSSSLCQLLNKEQLALFWLGV